MEWYEVRARRVGKPDHCSKSYDDEEDARSLSDRMNKNGHSTVIVKCQVVAVKVAVNAERDGSTVGATCSCGKPMEYIVECDGYLCVCGKFKSYSPLANAERDGSTVGATCSKEPDS